MSNLKLCVWTPKYALAHSEIAWIYATEGEVRNAVEALKHAQIAVELNQWKIAGHH